MKNITIITGAETSYYHFFDDLAASVRQGRQDFLAIVPVNRAVRRLKRLLIDQAKNQALADPAVFTFDTLLLELYRSFPQAKRLISREVFLVLIKDILSKHADDFPYFMPDRRLNDGLVQKVADAVSELRNFGYDHKTFLTVDPPDRQEHPQKYAAFGRILELLEEHFAATFIDEPFARAQAAQNLTLELFHRRFPKVKTVYISGYGLFSPPMLTFIERAGQWMSVKIKLDYVQENPQLFAHTQEALQKLQAIGAKVADEKPRTSALATFLFNRNTAPQKPLPLQERVKLAALTNREQEVKFIAGQIRALNRQGQPLHRIAVTFSHLEKYVPLLRRIFSQYGIPFNLSTGFELAKAPLIATFLGLFRLLGEDFPMEKTLGLLSTPLVKTPDTLDVSLIRQICLKTRTSHLNAGSVQRLQRLIEEKRLLVPEEDDDLPQSEVALQQIALLQEVLQPLYDFPREGTAVELRTHFLDLLNRYDLVHWYKLDNKHLSERQKERSFRAYNRFVKIFERTVWTLQIIYGQQNIHLQVLFGALESALERELYNLSEWQDYGVQIMPRLEILAVDFQTLFLGGLIDGDFPRSTVKDIFFGDDVRAAMGLAASEELLAQDRFLFYELLDSPAKTIFVTRPKYRDEEALVPSSFLADLTDIADVAEMTVTENDPLLENLQSLWERFGRNIFFLNSDQQLQEALTQADLLYALLPHPRKSLEDLLYRIRYASQRLMGDHFTRFEGNLSSNSSLVEDLQTRFARRVWSVSQLETYAFCPMHFFLKYVLKIRPGEEIEEEISPLERGALIHKILFRFYSELRAAGKADRPWEFENRLFEIAKEEFDTMPFQGLFWELEKLRYLGNERLKGIFSAFLEEEQKRLETLKARPSFFEWSFGYSGAFPMDPQSHSEAAVLEHEGQKLHLQGRIDRVDVLPDGGAMIIDYKTGTVHGKISDVVDGLHFQLPLYLYVLPQLNPELAPVYGGLYQLKSADACSLKPIIADKNHPDLEGIAGRSHAFIPNKWVLDETDNPLNFKTLLDHSVALAFRQIETLRQGQFRHTRFPDDDRCNKYCDYRRICQKVSGKLKREQEQATANASGETEGDT